MRSHAQFNASSLCAGQQLARVGHRRRTEHLLRPHLGIRGDVRHLRTLQDVTLGVFGNDKVDFWRGSAGAASSGSKQRLEP